MAVLQQDKHENTVALNEMRSELADLKHALNNAQVEIQILEEQVQNQESLSKKAKPGTSFPNDSRLEKRIAALEQMQEKIHADLKQLSSHANQTTTCLQQYSTKISEIEQNMERQRGDLKSSLKTLTSSLSTDVASNSNPSTYYKVKSGDSLEKIARNHNVSVDALKKANRLSQNKILVGQELIIP
jgi:LysM repeat protein